MSSPLGLCAWVVLALAAGGCSSGGRSEASGATTPASTNPCDALDCGPWLCVHNGIEAECMTNDEPQPEPTPDPAPEPEPEPEPLATPEPTTPAVCDVAAAACDAAVPSMRAFPSSNGFGAMVFDAGAGKVTALYEHLYRNWDEGVWTRNLVFDAYFGVRLGDQRVWLNERTPSEVRYLDESGIVAASYSIGDVRVDVFFYAPWQLERPALVMLARATNTSGAPVTLDLYSLHNFHVGYTSSAEPVRPDARDERLRYDTASGAYLESGVGGTLAHWPIGGATHHGATPNNPWQRLNAGLDLADDADSGMGDDRVAGFQQKLVLDAHASGWLGVVSAFDPGSSATELLAELADAFGGLSPAAELGRARAEWASWRKAPPAGLSQAELAVYRQSEAVLRMAQVRETTDRSHGQIVASLPPGSWNITWMRDMAYAIVALARMGHHAEARAALSFVLTADSGEYEASHVGVPYQVSITRYYGRGREETDVNEDGPNIEYDGFGLFLWALGEYIDASGDSSLLAGETGARVRSHVADALVSLIDDATGLVRADSSIWEVHWNGREKRHAYTSITAARGLCSLARHERELDHGAAADAYGDAGRALAQAIERELVTPANVLAASYEDCLRGTQLLDLAVTEAWALGVLDPAAPVASATLDALTQSLRVAHGFGFMRNDDGGWYDSREWVFIDLRLARALALAGRGAEAGKLVDWITAQGHANGGLLAELHDPVSRAYEGAVPMVGFGAGAYVLSMHERTAAAPAPTVSTNLMPCGEELP